MPEFLKNLERWMQAQHGKCGPESCEGALLLAELRELQIFKAATLETVRFRPSTRLREMREALSAILAD